MFLKCKEFLKNKVSEKRYLHSLSVSKLAGELAQKHGVSVEKAQIAGVLHDILKETPREEFLKMKDEFGVELTESEENSFPVWHSIFAPHYAKKVLGITDEEILAALCHHGSKQDLSTLQKIIIISDFAAYDRSYVTSEGIRELAFKNLDQALFWSLRVKIEKLLLNASIVVEDAISSYNKVILDLKRSTKTHQNS